MKVLDKIAQTVVPAFKRTKTTVIAKSPELLFIAGVVGVVGGTVLACKATLNVQDVVDDAIDDVAVVHQAVSDGDISEDEKGRALLIAYYHFALNLIKLYGPAIVVYGLSMTCLVKSNDIRKKRNAALLASYELLDDKFTKYRKRVANKIGEDAENDIYHGTIEETVEEIVEKDGKKKKVKKTVTKNDPSVVIPFSKLYDENNINYGKFWSDPYHARNHLNQCLSWANQMCYEQGYISFVDVLNDIGFSIAIDDLTPEELGAGWVWDYSRPKPQTEFQISFGLDKESENMYRFLNKLDSSVWLDFNCKPNMVDRIAAAKKVS